MQMMLLSSLIVLALVSGLKCHPVGYQAEDGASACDQLTKFLSSLEPELPSRCDAQSPDHIHHKNYYERACEEDGVHRKMSLAMDAILIREDSKTDLDRILRGMEVRKAL